MVDALPQPKPEKQVLVEGVGLVPMSALEMALVVAGVDLRELVDAEVVDKTEDDA